MTGGSDWRSDWAQFVRFMAEKYVSGISERDAGQLVAGQAVSWQGLVWENRLRAEHAPGIAVDMETVEVELPDRRMFVGTHVFLPVRDQATQFACSAMKRGDRIAFDAKISSRSTPFSSVGFAEDPEQRKVYLEVGVESTTIRR